MPDYPEAAAKLQKAVRNLYDAFGHFRGESNWGDALDNLPPERASRPERLPVKDLSWEDVDYFFSHAVCGDPRDRLKDELNAIRYFLPKVFEFNNRDGLPANEVRSHVCDWWFIGELLRHTAWHGWPVEQRKPIVSWFGAWLDAILLYEVDPPAEDNRFGDREPANRKPATWVEAVADLDLETAGFVSRFESLADRHLMGFAEALIFKRLYHPTGPGFFWDTDDPSRQQPLAGWLLNRRTAGQLEEAFFACDDPATAKGISITLELIEGIKRSVDFQNGSAGGRNA
jgi:hypothetical protein